MLPLSWPDSTASVAGAGRSPVSSRSRGGRPPPTTVAGAPITCPSVATRPEPFSSSADVGRAEVSSYWDATCGDTMSWSPSTVEASEPALTPSRSTSVRCSGSESGCSVMTKGFPPRRHSHLRIARRSRGYRGAMDHARAPILDAMLEFRRRGDIVYTPPGHKQGRGADPRAIEVLGREAFLSDVLATNGLDDRTSSHGYLQQAQELMADAVHADTAFFSTCGSSLSV